MNLQVKGRYIYVTMWDPLEKKPRRFYLGAVDRWEEHIEILKEIFSSARRPKYGVESYVRECMDAETKMTREELVFRAFQLHEFYERIKVEGVQLNGR